MSSPWVCQVCRHEVDDTHQCPGAPCSMAEKPSAPVIPERLRIGPFSFTVTSDPAAVAKVRHDENDGCLAQTDFSYLKITVDAEFPPDQVRVSMLHEVLHAVIHAAGRWQKGMDEETAVQRITGILLDTLRRNPVLVTFLTGEDAA